MVHLTGICVRSQIPGTAHACSVAPDERERAQLCQQRPRVGGVQAQELQRALQGHADACHGRQAVERLLALPGVRRGNFYYFFSLHPHERQQRCRLSHRRWGFPSQAHPAALPTRAEECRAACIATLRLALLHQWALSAHIPKCTRSNRN